MGAPAPATQLLVMHGHTLPELLVVMTLLAVGASAFVPTARRLSDLAAVSAAREALVGHLHEARATAVSNGGSRIVITSAPPTVRIALATSDGVATPVAVAEGVSVDLGGPDSTDLRFDALGIGRFANRTIVLRRGDASASMIVSSYGRVRRR